ncbi:MAG: M20/M25/M40 family metallo-hydrolase [Oscillospiraceae bacterium]|nr:M20/M25/M40 family metallo-hydrolase [Oscillospiraceae bacterium]
MDQRIKSEVERYSEVCYAEQTELLRQLGKIPAPTRQEDRRAAFCRDWLLAQGAQDVSVDGAKNVICKLGPQDGDLIVFAAHTDVVFPDLEALPMREENGILYAPGIGDDTANLVNLMMATKYLLQQETKLRCGLLIVANACEEGLGNLDGTKTLFATYGDRIKGFYSFDCDLPQCISRAVGSYRYRISCHTCGGHSYSAFGAPNAIEILCRLVEKLYALKLPEGEKTTFNVGRFEGGSTVNSIAQEATLLYEFRSASQSCLEQMEQKLRQTVESCRNLGGELTVELLGIRPGNGPVDLAALAAFTANSLDVIRSFCDAPVDETPCSTDSNVPLSRGIVANTIGTVRGGLSHTRQEWVELESLKPGLKIVLSLMLHYAAE